MKKKLLVSLIICLFVGALLYSTVMKDYSTDFHRSEPAGPGLTDVMFVLSGLEDTNVTIAFEVGQFVCLIDVSLYEPTFASSAFNFDVFSDSEDHRVQFEGLTRIKSLNVILGTRHDYNIVFASDCKNLNTAVEISNGGSNSGFYYYADGELSFSITETASSIGEEYMIGGMYGAPEICYIDIDLQDDVVGRIYISGTYSILENSGWYPTSLPGEYRTNSTSIDVDISVSATQTYARLID